MFHTVEELGEEVIYDAQWKNKRTNGLTYIRNEKVVWAIQELWS